MFTRQRERISSDEEERRRAGLRDRDLLPVPRTTATGRASIDATATDADGEPVSRLAYGDAATVRRINLGPTRRKNSGGRRLLLDPVTGSWLSGQAARRRRRGRGLEAIDSTASARSGSSRTSQDRRNILRRSSWPRRSTTAAAVIVSYALERGIEAAFQLEDSELDSELLPTETGRGPDAVHRVRRGRRRACSAACVTSRTRSREAAKEALRICHFDPDTGDDLGRARAPAEPRASGLLRLPAQLRQPARPRLIDRHRAGPAAGHRQASPTVDRRAGARPTRTERTALQADAPRPTATLEAEFVRLAEGQRLPAARRAQVTVDRHVAPSPDFVYQLPRRPGRRLHRRPGHDSR